MPLEPRTAVTPVVGTSRFSRVSSVGRRRLRFWILCDITVTFRSGLLQQREWSLAAAPRGAVRDQVSAALTQPGEPGTTPDRGRTGTRTLRNEGSPVFAS